MYKLIFFFWNIYALVYDTISFIFPYKEMMKDIYKYLNPSERDIIVDFGCGTGNLEMMIKTYKSFIAIDNSSSMVSIARKKNRGKDIQFELNNLNDYDFNFKFNKCVLSNVLYSLKNNSILKRIYDSIDENGLLIISNPKSDFNMFVIFFKHIKQIKCFHDSMITALIVPGLLMVAICNFIINVLERKNEFRIIILNELITTLEDIGFKVEIIADTFANQNILIVARK